MAPSETPVIGWVMVGHPMDRDEIHLVLVADKSVLEGWGAEDAGFDGMAFRYEMHLNSEVAQAYALDLTGRLEEDEYGIQIPPHAITLTRSSMVIASELAHVPVLRRKIISMLFLDGERLTPYA